MKSKNGLTESFLSLHLEGALMSFGHQSYFEQRKTATMPTKSSLVGMFCAALGYDRESTQEAGFIKKILEAKFTIISIPKNKPMGRMVDFHTVEGTLLASGKPNPNMVVTYREYLEDARFGVIVQGEKSLITMIGKALQNPIRGIWLGRRSCIPSRPVFGGIFGSQKKALEELIGEQPLSNFDYQVDAESFEDGTDTLFDNPVSFKAGSQRFSSRRVKLVRAK
jgi:CRISPR system Cascade subunit CasD